MKIDQHHLLECILWPNSDGTFRKIVNRSYRLENLGIYDDMKLTIPIEHGKHSSMHRQFEKGTIWEVKLESERNGNYGKRGAETSRFGCYEDKHPLWKGDNVTKKAKRRRERRRKARLAAGLI
jgi:hypothetical protein